MANAFSPNGDSANDIFKPNVSFITDYNMVVTNRYGEIVFQSDDPSVGWDGTFKSNAQPIGYYGWGVKFIDQDLKEQVYRGNVMLIR